MLLLTSDTRSQITMDRRDHSSQKLSCTDVLFHLREAAGPGENRCPFATSSREVVVLMGFAENHLVFSCDAPRRASF